MKTSMENKENKIGILTIILCIYIFLSIYNSNRYGATLSNVIVPVFVFFIATILYKFNTPMRIRSNQHLIFLFWLSLFIATVFSDIVVFKRDIITALVFTLLFIFATVFVYNRREIKVIIMAYWVTTFVCASNIYVCYILNIQHTWHRYSIMVFGVTKDANYTSAYMLPALAIMLYYSFYSRKINKKKQIFLFCLAAYTSIAIFLTGSRAALLCLVVICLFLVIKFIIREYKHPLKIMLVTIVVTAIFIGGYEFISINLASSTGPRLLGLDSLSDDIRFELWRTAFQVFLQHPIIGGGMNAGSTLVLEAYDHYSHNLFLDILTNQGLVGSIILLSVYWNLVSVKGDDKFFIILILVSYIQPLISINGYNTTSFWTPLILLQILCNAAKYDNVEMEGLFDSDVQLKSKYAFKLGKSQIGRTF